MLFHGALFELALFEIPGDDDGVEEIHLSDSILVSVASVLAPITPTIHLTDSLSVLLDDVLASVSGEVALADAITPRMDTTFASVGSVGVTDVAAVALNDTLGILVHLDRSDSIRVRVDDSLTSVSGTVSLQDAISVLIDGSLESSIDIFLSTTLSVRILEDLIASIRQPPKSAVGSIGIGSASGNIRAAKPLGRMGTNGSAEGVLRAARPIGGYGSGSASGKIRH